MHENLCIFPSASVLMNSKSDARCGQGFSLHVVLIVMQTVEEQIFLKHRYVDSIED